MVENERPAEKRKVLDFVLSNFRWRDSKLQLLSRHRMPLGREFRKN